jgi:drug/metabolite transporter (DMT)-like permease
MNLYNISLKYTSATVASATSNSVPVVTFFLAVLLRLEVVRLRSPSGMAKAAGVALCLAGVMTIALYTGPSMSPVNHHRAFAHHNSSGRAELETRGGSKGTWIKGTFMMLLANITWSLWIVLQVGGHCLSLVVPNSYANPQKKKKKNVTVFSYANIYTL